MASLALGIAGIALAPASAGASTVALYAAIGSAVGGVLDAFVINPLLSPSQSFNGPRLDDVRISTASEGSDLALGNGPENPVSGRFIWIGPLIEVETEVEQGGKGGAFGGGGGSSSRRREYYVDLAIAWCEGLIGRVVQVKLDAKNVYTAGVLSATRAQPSVTLNLTTVSLSATDNSVSNTTDVFQDFRVGRFITMSGWTGTAGSGSNNGRFRIVTKVSNRKLVLERAIRNLPVGAGLVLSTEAAGASIQLIHEEYDIPVSDARYESITHYTGSENQVASSVIEAVRGVGKVPAYRGTAYTVIKRLALKDFGNRIPNATAIVEVESEASVGYVIKKILSRYGLADSDIDTSRVSGCVRGYPIQGAIDGLSAVRPLMLYYDLLVQDAGGTLKFFHRGQEPQTFVPATDLGASSNDGTVLVYNIEDSSGYDLPGECIVSYLDPAIDYQTGSQSYKRIDKVVDGQASIQLSLVMTSNEAQALGRRVLWQAWAERQRARFFLPPKYWRLLEGEVVRVAIGDTEYTVRLTEMTQGANWIVEAVGTLIDTTTVQASDPDDYVGVVGGDANNGGDGNTPGGGVNPTNPYVPPAVTLNVLDIPALRETDITVPGVYWTMCATDPGAQWRGASALASSNNTDFVPVFTTGPEQVSGSCLSVLRSGPHGYWDYANTLDVELLHGTLASVSPEAVLEGANWSVVGDEIVGFQTATFLSNGLYRISNLLRGLRGTEYAIPFHRADERFVPVDALTAQFWSYGSGLVGASRFMKGVAAGAIPDGVSGVVFPLRGNTLRQFGPCNLTLVRNGSRDVAISWVRRSRALSRLFAPGDSPLLADREEYDIVLCQPAGVEKLVLRVVGATSTTVTAAQQTSAGINAAQNLVCKVFQIGPVVGRGFPSQEVTR